MWPHLAFFSPLGRVLGGRRSTTLLHEGFAAELVLFFFGHMLMVATTGLRANLRAIIRGHASGSASERAPIARSLSPSLSAELK